MSVIIGLHQIKYLDNLAQIRRVVSAYGGGDIYTTGRRILDAWRVAAENRLPRELRMKAYDNAPIFTQGINEFNLTPLSLAGFTPVAVELVDGAQSLPWFDHPEQAMYVFGPEDGSIPSQLLRQCHAVVQIPSAHCLNVSHAVATVLYDRRMKVDVNL